MKITVITVVLNNKAYIADCINSVINQTYKNYEYIIIDGGSTDGTVDIIRDYQRYISAWISEADCGIFDAMNKGIMLARGEVIAFLNSDDLYYDSCVLENVVDTMLSSGADACFADMVYVKTQDLDNIVRYWRAGSFKPELLKKGWIPAHPTFFARKTVYDQYGLFDLRYKLAADYELMARFLADDKIQTAYIPKTFAKMRVGGASNNSIKNIIRQNVEILQACKKNDIQISPLSFLANKLITRLCQFYLRPVR